MTENTQFGEDSRFVVIAEGGADTRPLLMTDLTFGRLMDEIVVPYQADEPFFIDGVPIKQAEVRKLKICLQTEHFQTFFGRLHWLLRTSDQDQQSAIAAEYMTRLEALTREAATDVTSQVIKAYDARIRPTIKEYLPRRQELIDAALRMFVESMKALGGGS